MTRFFTETRRINVTSFQSSANAIIPHVLHTFDIDLALFGIRIWTRVKKMKGLGNWKYYAEYNPITREMSYVSMLYNFARSVEVVDHFTIKTSSTCVFNKGVLWIFLCSWFLLYIYFLELIQDLLFLV